MNKKEKKSGTFKIIELSRKLNQPRKTREQRNKHDSKDQKSRT